MTEIAISTADHGKNNKNDPVNHPAHYCDGGIETLDFIVAKKLDFFLGQVCKYISRAGKKDPAKELEDLQKARFYLNRKIELLEKEKLLEKENEAQQEGGGRHEG